MVEPGLAQRLRRYSRNSGMMIGVSMAAAIIICIAAFIWLYIQIGPLMSDFIPSESETSEEADDDTAGLIGQPDDDDPASNTDDDEFALDEIEPEPMGTSESDDEDEDDETSDSGDGGIGGPDMVGTDDEDEDDNDNQDEDEAEDEWTPTHQIRDGPNVNFRSGPNTISDPQGSLAPGTPLQFLDDEEPGTGVIWMYFEIEDGTDGWIRDIDVIEYQDDDNE